MSTTPRHPGEGLAFAGMTGMGAVTEFFTRPFTAIHCPYDKFRHGRGGGHSRHPPAGAMLWSGPA